MSFDIEKTKAVLFTKIRKNLLIRLAENNKIRIGGTEIKFNINVIRWLGVILDPGLKLKVYVNLRMEKARNVKVRVKEILNRFSLTSNLTRRIYIVVV